MRYQRGHKYTEKELQDYLRWSKLFRIGVAVLCVVVVIIALFIAYDLHDKKILAQEEQQKIEQAERLKRQQRERELEYERWQRDRYLDSLKNESYLQMRAAEHRETETPPRYTWNELENMVRKVAKENCYATVWKMDEDCWMMHYSTGEGKKKKHYFRKINVHNKTYGPVMRMKSPELDEFYLASNPKHRYKMQGAYLVYYVNGVEKERWTPQRSIDPYSYEDPRDEGYDSWEDYYNDNEEDLYFYYGGR